ncbi:RNA-binding protein [Leptospira inadai serovar Lyme]|uniref:RNA-binding protein n=2 Tax=Leptospira inadai TaxID=29506 RepID=A0ABX4YIF9_9LEPT|nr:RNA-binding protein [Leptospira inadai serovar Lyme]
MFTSFSRTANLVTRFREMHLVVDGFNLIYKFPELEAFMYSDRLREARVGLLRILEAYSSKIKNPNIHVFFDGKKEKGSEVRKDAYGNIQVYFSQDLKADDLIKDYIKYSPRPSELFIVSSDQEILLFAKRLGSKTITSEDFAAKVADAFSEKPRPMEKDSERKLSPGEILYWKELFKKGK